MIESCHFETVGPLKDQSAFTLPTLKKAAVAIKAATGLGNNTQNHVCRVQKLSNVFCVQSSSAF